MLFPAARLVVRRQFDDNLEPPYSLAMVTQTTYSLDEESAAALAKLAHYWKLTFLFNATGRRRRMMVDCMIAAVAIAEDAPLATRNADDFGRFVEPGLKLA